MSSETFNQALAQDHPATVARYSLLSEDEQRLLAENQSEGKNVI